MLLFRICSSISAFCLDEKGCWRTSVLCAHIHEFLYISNLFHFIYFIVISNIWFCMLDVIIGRHTWNCQICTHIHTGYTHTCTQKKIRKNQNKSKGGGVRKERNKKKAKDKKKRGEKKEENERKGGKGKKKNKKEKREGDGFMGVEERGYWGGQDLILITLDRHECFSVFHHLQKDKQRKQRHSLKLGKKRRESSKRNHYIIFPRVIINTIIHQSVLCYCMYFQYGLEWEKGVYIWMKKEYGQDYVAYTFKD